METRPDLHGTSDGGWFALGALFLCVAAFVAIATLVHTADGLLGLDARAHDVVYGLIGPREDLMVGVTFFGNNATLIPFVGLAAAGLLLAKRKGLALRVLAASGLGGLVIMGLKQLFQRVRPIDQVIPADGFSFPSGHAFAATVFYSMMIVLVWRLTDRPWLRGLGTVLGVLVIGAVGLSRVYLNVHYMTDVLAGWAAGLAWLTAALLFIDGVERRRTKTGQA